jgi:hypothetical protein
MVGNVWKWEEFFSGGFNNTAYTISGFTFTTLEI